MSQPLNDYPSFRKTFAQNKRDGTLDQLPLLIWGYRVGAAGFVIYSAWDFFGLIVACTTPVPGFTSSLTVCEYAAQVGVLYAIVIEILLMGIILIGHLASIVLSVFVMRWRKQWLDFYASSSTSQQPFHPGRAFVFFTAASVGNAAFLLLIGVIFFILRAIGGGFGFALIGVVGGLYTAYLGRLMWSIDFNQPLVSQAAVPNVAMQPPVYQTPVAYDNGAIAKPYDPKPYDPAVPHQYPQSYNPGAVPQPYNPSAVPPQPYNPNAAPANPNPANAYYPPQP